MRSMCLWDGFRQKIELSLYGIDHAAKPVNRGRPGSGGVKILQGKKKIGDLLIRVTDIEK